MLNLFLPYIIGVAVGIAPQGGTGDAAATPPVALSEPAGSGDDITARTPEPQVPTGQFTTALEVKPILAMTQGNWVSVRNYEGQDLLYFTHLLAWRCGLWDINFGMNGAPPLERLAMEPCHEDTNAPNALTEVADILPYVVYPENAIESVTVEIVFDDGTTETATFERSQIQIP